MNDTIALIKRASEHGVEVDGPDPVIGFLEPNRLIHQGIGEADQPVLKADRSCRSGFVAGHMSVGPASSRMARLAAADELGR